MKIGVPTQGKGGLDAEVAEHFGHAPTYTLYDTETAAVEIIPNTSHHMGGIGHPPELLAQHGVNVVLCRGIGPHALALLEKNRITVHTGATGTVREALEAWRSGRLSGTHGRQDHDSP
ncbi:MAG: NifB/NifX family molybdenum-iron cluster-binding protein [Candidatus Bipolaricaulaceae bacterium]